MTGPGAGWWERTLGTGLRPVVLSSPVPPGECLRRLTAVTDSRGASWYLGSRTADRPVPRLRGQAGPYGIFVARFPESSGRGSFTPWLDARLEPADGGGTRLTGMVGLHPSVRGLLPVLVVVWVLIAAGFLAGSIKLASAGHFAALETAVPALFTVVVLIAGLRAAGQSSLLRAAVLLEDIGEIIRPGEPPEAGADNEPVSNRLICTLGPGLEVPREW